MSENKGSEGDKKINGFAKQETRSLFRHQAKVAYYNRLQISKEVYKPLTEEGRRAFRSQQKKYSPRAY